MKKITIFLVIAFAAFQCCFGQMLDISKLGLQTTAKDSYENNSIPKKAFIYSIDIAVNKSGIIDSVYFSKTENIDLENVVNLSAIKATIKLNKNFFKPYKNSVIIAPVMIINLNDQFISFQNELLREWATLFPEVTKFKNRRVVLCKTINRSYIIDYN